MPIAYTEGIRLPTKVCFDCQLSLGDLSEYQRIRDPWNADTFLAKIKSVCGAGLTVSLRKDLKEEEPVPELTVSLAEPLSALERILNSEDFVFRGQVKEYYSDRRAWMAPAMFRRQAFYDLKDEETAIDKLAFDHQHAAMEWIAALSEVLPPAAVERRYYFPNNSGFCRKDVSLLVERPWIVAVMQHYGYPTQLLDVTENLETALWFATHQFQQSSLAGVYEYVEATFKPDLLSKKWPTIYLFSKEGIIDWPPSNIPVDSIERPSAQSGKFLNFGRVTVAPKYRDYISFDIEPWEPSEHVSAVLKISPRLLDSIIKRRAEELFPLADPFVEVLQRTKPQGFVAYR